MPVELAPVASSNISHVGYDPAARELHVQFLTGGVHAYSDVSPDEHAAFMASASKGQHFAKVIRAAKASRKVSTP